MNADANSPDTRKDDDGKPDWAMNARERENAERRAKGLPVKRRRWPLIVAALIVLAIVGWIVFAPKPAPEPEVAGLETPTVMQLNGMEVTTIARQNLEQTIKVSGALKPSVQSQLSSQVSGRIDTVAVRPGDSVAKGDLLAQVDVENLTIQLAQQKSTADATRAQLELARSQLARTRTLSERGLSSDSVLEQGQSNVDALAANLAAQEGQIEAAEISLANATITAPFDGVVATRMVEPGQLVSTGAAILTLVDLARMEMQAIVPVGAGTRVKPGQRVYIKVDGIDGAQFEGVVDRINPVALEGTRALPVYVMIDNANQQLRGGMFATGQIVVAEREDGLAVPALALREDPGGTYVLKIADGQLVRQSVTSDQQWAGGRLAGITEGLVEGDVIVSASLPELRAGDAVQVVGE